MKLTLITTLFALLLSFSANALTLQEAKKAGFLGELPNGYIGLVTANDEAKSIMAMVNQKRLVHFKKIAVKNGLSVAQVAELAGAKFIAKTSGGNFIKNSAGKWVKK
ncbi:MAG: YdbL family protein [Alteromonadaceae bacterium]|nr:YdbL family protein [Alteromonadaceae bacterium]